MTPEKREARQILVDSLRNCGMAEGAPCRYCDEAIDKFLEFMELTRRRERVQAGDYLTHEQVVRHLDSDLTNNELDNLKLEKAPE